MTDLTVWYDGGCPLCRREIALMQRLDRARAITFVDVDKADGGSCPIDRADLLARFHAREDGVLLSGAAAFAAMWRAIPRLRVRPNRTLANGERIRFVVRLPGPASGRRRVAIEARAGGRWIRIAGGRTSHSGSWRGRYRFHATTGTREINAAGVARLSPVRALAWIAATRRRLRTSHQAIRPPAARRSHRSVQ